MVELIFLRLCISFHSLAMKYVRHILTGELPALPVGGAKAAASVT